MPRLCLLDGIVIWINTRDHLPPHFHARFSGDEVRVLLDDLLAAYRALRAGTVVRLAPAPASAAAWARWLQSLAAGAALARTAGGASTITWALVPLKPKALIPARGTGPRDGHARASVTTCAIRRHGDAASPAC